MFLIISRMKRYSPKFASVKTDRVKIMYFSFGLRLFRDFRKLVFLGFSFLVFRKKSGTRESVDIAAAVSMIFGKDHWNFQKRRRTNREPMIAPDVSIAWWIPKLRPLFFAVSIRIASRGASRIFPNLSREMKVMIWCHDVAKARNTLKMTDVK